MLPLKVGVLFLYVNSMTAARTIMSASPLENSAQLNERDHDSEVWGASSQCTNSYLVGPAQLYAECITTKTTKTSTLDLNTCIANIDGNLVWTTNGGGNYGHSCEECQLVNSENGMNLSCNCRNMAGEMNLTNISLGMFLKKTQYVHPVKEADVKIPFT